jgi:hypothetical protein
MPDADACSLASSPGRPAISRHPAAGRRNGGGGGMGAELIVLLLMLAVAVISLFTT